MIPLVPGVAHPVRTAWIPKHASQHGVSPHVLRKLAAAGQLPTVRPAGLRGYYLPADLELPARTCKQCGTSLEDYACNRTYCASCRADLKRERHRDWMAARRRLRAVTATRRDDGQVKNDED